MMMTNTSDSLRASALVGGACWAGGRRHAWRGALYCGATWPADRAIIDCFGDAPIHQITRALTAVGLGSPPSWLKPYTVLSNGEKFRCVKPDDNS